MGRRAERAEQARWRAQQQAERQAQAQATQAGYTKAKAAQAKWELEQKEKFVREQHAAQAEHRRTQVLPGKEPFPPLLCSPSAFAQHHAISAPCHLLEAATRLKHCVVWCGSKTCLGR